MHLQVNNGVQEGRSEKTILTARVQEPLKQARVQTFPPCLFRLERWRRVSVLYVHALGCIGRTVTTAGNCLWSPIKVAC